MPVIPVLCLAPGNQWDQHMLRLLLADRLYPTGLDFEFVHLPPDLDQGLVLVIPGRYWYDRVEKINALIEGRPWVLAMRTGDEEDLLDPSEVDHPNIRWWIQTPRVGHDYGDAHLFGVGYPPHFTNMPADWPTKRLDVFLAAQNTHDRRRQAFDHLEGHRGEDVIVKTAGFTEGMPTWVYARNMTIAKVAPAPAGPASPDTFRLYEALEAHAVPIADDITPAYGSAGYWALVAPGAPFPVLADYGQLAGQIASVLRHWPERANRAVAWWIGHKRAMAHRLRDDIAALTATPSSVECMTIADIVAEITVIITASPIESHLGSDTSIIDETVASVRERLPNAEIILVHDGVRPEQEHLRAGYEEYLRRVLWKADHDWHHVLVLINEEHLHQGVAVMRALRHVITPLILFVEHDTPLTGEIPWDSVGSAILDGQANCIRFHHEASILLPHKHLMLDDEPQMVSGAPMMRTAQWSQRPHLASVAFYRQLLANAFAAEQANFIEDVVYGKLCDAVHDDGVMGWQQWRTWIYTPPGDIKRSYHTDGRAGASKFT